MDNPLLPEDVGGADMLGCALWLLGALVVLCVTMALVWGLP